jgi:hypothetical protein
MLAGPACRHPATALPRLPLSLLHPTTNTGSHFRLAPPVSRAAPCHPRPTALPCSSARLRHEHALLPMTTPPGAILALRHPLSLFLPPPCGMPEPTPPRFPSLLSPRAGRVGEDASASLRCILCPSSSSPPSPPPMRPPHRLLPLETPSSSPVLVRAPPLSSLHGETLPSAIVVSI